MMDKKVLYFFSNRVLLIYLLLFNLEESVFITHKNYFEENKKFNHKLDSNLILIDDYLINNILKQNIFKMIRKIILIIFYSKIYEVKKIMNKNVGIYGQDHSILGQMLVKKNNFFLIEDGTINYKKFKNIFLKKMIKKLLGVVETYGRYKNVKKIYLTGLAQIPKEIENKVEIINLKNLWDLKTKEEQQEILEVFGFNSNQLKELEGRNMILYTQPLSEDGVVTEKEKIELYSKIILKYPKEKLILKMHPREKTNYKDIFKEILVLEQSFPAEIFELLEIKFDKGITIFSTAVLSTKSKEIDFYGTEAHHKLLERFGSMEHIIKRNKFL